MREAQVNFIILIRFLSISQLRHIASCGIAELLQKLATLFEYLA